MTHRFLGRYRDVDAWGVDVSAGHDGPDAAGTLEIDLMIQHGWTAFRGVSMDRLPQILLTGVDVVPSDAPIYCGDLDKAYEYGGLPKVVMAFRGEHGDRRLLERTFQRITADMPAEQIADLLETYPHRYEGDVPGEARLSRIDDPNPARWSYERAYAYWLPGDPWDALVGLIVFGSAEHLEAATRLIQEEEQPRPATAAK